MSLLSRNYSAIGIWLLAIVDKLDAHNEGKPDSLRLADCSENLAFLAKPSSTIFFRPGAGAHASGHEFENRERTRKRLKKNN
ncbi:MAG: hypothetical protein O7G31_12205 [Calditrichaeota bacterium]|nr:hypothetical protein [Calditrichota bacterium]